MAGSFYNLQEVIQKLGKDEEYVKELVKQSKLREFRDGAKQLFKSEEVDRLAAALAAGGKSSEVELVLDESGEINLEATKAPDIKSEGGFNLSNIGQLSAADTAAGKEGISVLGESDQGFKLADSKAETQEAELSGVGNLDADSNMENLGSGSGLLDLSLQADDTSLGAVLDDILPAVGDGETAPAAAQAGVVAEADKIFEQAAPGVEAQALAEGESIGPAPAGFMRYAESEPDAVSNACGFSLFLPLAALILTAIVLVASYRGIQPGLLALFAGKGGSVAMIWYVAAGMTVLVLLIIGVAAMMSGKKGKGGRRQQAV